MLIYKLLGDSAQQEFAKSFGISYGLGAATEWQARAAPGQEALGWMSVCRGKR